MNLIQISLRNESMSFSRYRQTYKWLIVLKHVWKQINDSESISHNNGNLKLKLFIKRKKKQRLKKVSFFVFLFFCFSCVVNEKNCLIITMFLH